MSNSKVEARNPGVTEEDFVRGNQLGMQYKGRYAVLEIAAVGDDHLTLVVRSGGTYGEEFEIKKDDLRHRNAQVLQKRI